MNLSPAQHGNDFVACLFQLQAALHYAGMVLGHLHGVLVAKKVRRMQHVDVQRVAFDPFTAVDQPPQFPQLTVHIDAKGAFNSVDGTHLISNRADSADSCCNVWNFVEAATAKKSLEETWRLKDFQFDVNHITIADLDVKSRLAFDTSQVVNLDRLRFHAPRFPCGTVQHTH